MAKRSIDIIIAAQNRTRRALESVNRGLGGLQARMAGLKVSAGGVASRMLSLRNITIGGIGLYGLARAARAAITESAGFEQQLANVSTMLSGDASTRVAEYRHRLIAMAEDFGEATETLSKGLYDILSSGVAPAEAMSVLTVAVKAARAGVTDTAVSVDGLTTILNAYQMEATEAARVSDLMFQVVKDGKINFQQLAENVGKLAPTAKAAGLSLEQMAAAIATAVKVEKPERAMTAISAAIAKAAEEGQSLMDLVERFEGKSFQEIIGAGISRRAATGVALLAGNMQTLRREMVNMRNSAGATEEAYKKMADSPAMALARMRQQFVSIGRTIGQALLPTVTRLSDLIRANREAVASWAKSFAGVVGRAAALVVANRHLIVSLAKVAAGVTGVIVLGPPLIGMLKGVSAAALYLVKNPMMLLGVAVAGVVAAFIDWDKVMARIKARLGVCIPQMEDAVGAWREAASALKAEHDELRTKAQRLAELQGKQSLTNREMLEARELTVDLTRAYPKLSTEIKSLGKSVQDTAGLFARMNDESAKHVKRMYENQLKAAERYLTELQAKHEKAAEAVKLAGKKAFDVYTDRGGAIYGDPVTSLWNLASDMLGGALPKGGMEGDVQKIQDEIDANKALAESYKPLQRQIANTKDEIERIKAILTEPAKQQAPETNLLGKVSDWLHKLPRYAQSAVGALRDVGSAVKAVVDKWEQNSQLRWNLKNVQARGIADDLQRETERIKLQYAQRIEAARKAGQDIRLLEMARDEEIAQARRKAETKQAEERRSRAKSLASEIVRLQITTTKEGLARELSLLKQAQKEELAKAADDAERALIKRKYELLSRQAMQNSSSRSEQTPGPVSIGVVDRGFLARAPGQYNPHRDAQKKRQEMVKQMDRAAKAGEAALAFLRTIAEKLGLKPPVADF